MVKFEKLNIDSVAKIKKRVIAVIIALAVSSGLYVGFNYLQGYTASLADEHKQTLVRQSELETLSAHTADLHETLKGMSYEQSTLSSKEDIVIAIGECVKKAGCDITGLSSKTISSEKSITRYNFTFEVKGTMKDVANVLKNIDAQNLHYAVNELSLRQEADYLWLQRNFDNDISWWDLSNLSTKGGTQTKNQITSKEIMSDNTMKFYLDLDFIVISEVL